MKKYFLVFLVMVICSFDHAYAQITSKQIDSLTELTLKTFDVPGIAVAVIKDGKVIHAKGYGVRSNFSSDFVLKNHIQESSIIEINPNSR